MGTVVLLPQDCLTASHKRHEKHQYKNMIYLQEAPQRAKRNHGHASSRKLNSHNQHFEYSSRRVPHTSSKMSGDLKFPKNRKQADENSEFPVVTILQRPRDKETRELLFTQFIMDIKNTPTKLNYREAEDTSNKSSRNVPDSENMKPMKSPQNIKSRSEKHIKLHRDQKTSSGKSAMTRVSSGNKPLNVLEKKLDKVNTTKSSRADYKKVTVKKTDDMSAKFQVLPSDDAQKTEILIRRASSDPQAVVQLANQYQLKLVTEESNQKLPDLSKTMSSHEHWAGSAYSFSPAPSSLPLPKFSLNLKTSSVQQSPISKPEGPRHVYTQPTVVVSSPTQANVVDNYDVVLATKSLRKILNLDP